MSLTIAPAESWSAFAANPTKPLEHLRSGEPLELIVAGGESVVIQDAAHYRKLLSDLDRLETIAAIKECSRDLAAGRTFPVREAFAELARKHGLQQVEGSEP